jgi:hypothetical protein
MLLIDGVCDHYVRNKQDISLILRSTYHTEDVNMNICSPSVLKVEVKSIPTKCTIIDMRALLRISMGNELCRGGR